MTERPTLVDRQAIADVVLRYCRGIDRLDLELVRDCYHPDATDEHGTFIGHARRVRRLGGWRPHALHGHDARRGQPAHRGRTATTHAHSETYGVAYHWGDPPDDHRRNFTTGFRYVDRFARRDGEWRIARRVAVREWTHVVPAEQQLVIPPERDGRRGRRDRDDAAYE